MGVWAMKLPEKKMLKNIDYPFVLALFAILGLSVVVMPSAASAAAAITHIDDLATRHIRSILIGLMAIVFILALDYRQWQKYSKYLYAGSIVMLLLVLTPFGHEAMGAQRWIDINKILPIFGGPVTFQPSEFVKVAIIIAFADFLAKRQGNLENFKQFLPCFVFVGIPTLIVFGQDLGTSLVFIAILIGMMFIAGANAKLLFGLIAGVLATGIGLIYAQIKWGIGILPIRQRQLDRLTAFLDPHAYADGAGFQLIQSKVAIGSGGITGQGLFQASQIHLNFLPEKHTDFIFSVVGAELGFIGAVILLALYFFLIYRCIDIMANAKDMFGILMVAGVTSMMLFHIFINVGMTMGIMPITGIPLPLFSYGGTSMIANLIALGIVLNVNIRRKKIIF